MKKAIRIGLQTVPLNEQIEGSHSKSQACLEVLPVSVCYPFEMADGRKYGQYCLNNHTNIPGFRLADLQIFRIALFGIKTMISQDNHLIFKRLDERMKESIVDIRSGAIPITHQTFLVEQATNLAPDNPAAVRISFLPDLFVTPTFPTGMQHFDTIAVHYSQHSGLRQKAIRPSPMCF